MDSPEIRYLLTIHSHGLGVLGLFEDLDKAKAAATEDQRLRTESENENLTPDDEDYVQSVALEFTESDSGTYQSVFDQGVHVHYYDIQPLTTGVLLDGF